MIRINSFPVQNIQDTATRVAIDNLQRAIQFGFSKAVSADELDKVKLRANADATVTVRQPLPRRIVTPETPAPTPTGDFVKKIGDLMSGRLGITIRKTQNGTVEGLGILNIGYTTHDRAELWNNGTTYDAGVFVANNGVIWESLQDGNLANDPFGPSPAWWLQRALECQTWVKDTWDIGTTYDQGDTVHDPTTNYIYTSLQDANVGNDPSVSPLWWSTNTLDQHWTVLGDNAPNYDAGAVVKFGNALWTSLQSGNLGHYPYPYEWDVAKTYAIDDQVRFTDGLLYTSLTNGNVGNAPDVSPTDWDVATGNIWWSGQTAVVNGAQINSFGLNGAGLGVTFGMACEAWNGSYPTATTLGRPTQADRTLIGAEPSVINRNPNSTQAKVALDVTFKNRADTEFFTAMPLGDNQYNINARAIQFSAFQRSPTDEYCGWPCLMKVNQFSTDISSNSPFTVILDMYDQSKGNDGTDTWWHWWATGLGPLPASQPLGWEGGIRYNETNKTLEYHGNIVDGTQIAGWINFDAPFADYTLALPLNYDYVNLGTIWIGRQVFDGTGDAIGGTSGSCQFNGPPNFAVTTHGGAGALIGYFEVEINGTVRRVPYH